MPDRKSITGSWLTKALFWEERHPDYTPEFTTKSEDMVKDGVTYISMKKLYLDYEDPTEYSFAIDVLGSWDHWQFLCASYTIGKHIQKWRDELEIKIKSKAIKAMIKSATQEGSKGTTAAKYIAEKGWEKKAGRPSKAEVERQKKIHAGITSEIDEDAERLGITH